MFIFYLLIHKPGIITEKTRILKSEGRIERYKNENNYYIDHERVWLKDEDDPGFNEQKFWR